MAGAGAKKRAEDNRKRLQTLRTLQLIGLGCQLAKLAWKLRFDGHVSSWSVTGMLVTTAVGAACYMTIKSIAAPTYGPDGDMIDGGGDLNRGGINGYTHDVLYINAFVQVATMGTSLFWYTYLAVPAYALYKFVELVAIPWWKAARAGSNSDSSNQVDAAARKKVQRSEERAQRRRMKWR